MLFYTLFSCFLLSIILTRSVYMDVVIRMSISLGYSTTQEMPKGYEPDLLSGISRSLYRAGEVFSKISFRFSKTCPWYLKPYVFHAFCPFLIAQSLCTCFV
uniref:Putative secreted protein n=1 Tax=Anopheles marajoara TaxID=58244 RepID=A0A2M4C9S4_9DIPT